MKRWTLRLAALSGIVVLGLIAIAEAQRNTDPTDYGGRAGATDPAAPAAPRDPFALKPDRVATIPLQGGDETSRPNPGSTARIVSVEDRPAKRPDDRMRVAADSSDAASDQGAAPNDPFNVGGRSTRASAPPRRFNDDASATELPSEDGSARNLRSGRAANSDSRMVATGVSNGAADGNSNIGTNSRYSNSPRQMDRTKLAAVAPAQRLDDRDARPVDGGSPFPPAAMPPVSSEPGTHNVPFGSSTTSRGATSNSLRPQFTDSAPTDLQTSGEGTGRPGIKQLEGAQSPQLTIEKFAPPEVQVGKPAKFEIKVRNAGSVPAQGVEIHDEIPKGTKLISATPASNQGPRGELVWSLGTLNPGDQVTAQLELMPIAEGELGSVASVTFRADASARTLSTKPQLVLQVSAPKQVMKGEDVTLSIRLSNPGTGAATGVVLAEKVPNGLTHPAGGELEFEVGTIKPGQSRQVDLTLKAAQAGRVVNSITAHGEGNLKVEERADFDVIAPALAVAMTGPTRRYLERQATYTVSVSNPGSAPARDVQLVTQLPRGLKFVKANNSGQYDPNTNTVSWSLEELPAAETGSVTLVAMPVEVGEQRIRVQGKAQQGLSDEHDQAIVVEGIAALAFDVQASDEAIEIGGETTYQIHVVNQGSKAASNVQIAVVLPPELKATHAEGPSRDAVEDHRVQFEPLARLAPKSDATFRIRAQAIGPGDLRVRVQLMTDEMRQPITKEESTRVYTDQ
jgi:uncharacterized repeat protein (TIGR01451 family)